MDELIVRIRDQEEISILLIEHDMRLVMSLSDRISSWTTARKSPRAPRQRYRDNPAVIKAYLGEELDA